MSMSTERMGRIWLVVVGLMVGAHAGDTVGPKTQAAAGPDTTTTVGAKKVATARNEASAEQMKRRQGEAKRIDARVKRLERKAEKAARAREAAKNPPKPEKVFISNEPSPSEKGKE